MKYLELKISNQNVELNKLDEANISFDYWLEDPENFQSKKGSQSLDITVPATLQNDKVFNTFHNPQIQDLTNGQIFRNHRPCSIISEGQELLIGKSFLKSATHTDKPTSYKINCYGGNADWIIGLKETNLFDILKDIKFQFTKAAIEASWAYDGTDPLLPYVFAPVRYKDIMDNDANNDINYKPDYMKASLSAYWTIFKGFKSIGYRIESKFLDTSYFRRLVMPWTFGSFLGDLDIIKKSHGFWAQSIVHNTYTFGAFTGYMNAYVTNDFILPGYDANNDYTYIPGTFEERWEYRTNLDFGNLDAYFSWKLDHEWYAQYNSNLEVRVQWKKNGVMFDCGQGAYNGNGNLVVQTTAPVFGDTGGSDNKTFYAKVNVNPGDVVTVQIYVHQFLSKLGDVWTRLDVQGFTIDYFRIPIGGTVNFNNFNYLKKTKFLDCFSGFVDFFNLSIQTDNVNRVVYIEPTHPYSLTNNLAAKGGGYFDGKSFIDWNSKQDLKEESEISLYADNEREFLFKMKDDTQDGMLKNIQDKNVNTLGMGKYLFSERFKEGQKEFENRFFSPVIHYFHGVWSKLSAVRTQLVCLIPENISNTSKFNSENTFLPKLCYYKGLRTDAGHWIWDDEEKSEYPFMFAVNYNRGGENDPILSYSDEAIFQSITPQVFSVGKGLLKRFFWQRCSILQNGQFYKTNFYLNNYDAKNLLHREHKLVKGEKWELVKIEGYKANTEQSTACFLR
jgi:hypothetical protein